MRFYLLIIGALLLLFSCKKRKGFVELENFQYYSCNCYPGLDNYDSTWTIKKINNNYSNHVLLSNKSTLDTLLQLLTDWGCVTHHNNLDPSKPVIAISKLDRSITRHDTRYLRAYVSEDGSRFRMETKYRITVAGSRETRWQEFYFMNVPDTNYMEWHSIIHQVEDPISRLGVRKTRDYEYRGLVN